MQPVAIDSSVITIAFIPQLENIGNFLKAITKYGVKLHDSFEANDLYENCNLTQVQTTLMALASLVSASTVTTLIKMLCNYLIEPLTHSSLAAKVISYFTQAKTKGYHTKSDIGIRYAEKQHRVFNNETLKAGKNIIGLQVWADLAIGSEPGGGKL